MNRRNAKLKKSQVRLIKRALQLGIFTQQAIADMFHVSKQAINHINTGYTWNHVE